MAAAPATTASTSAQADQFYTTIPKKLAIDMGSGNDTVELGRAGNYVGANRPGMIHRLYVNKGIYVDLGAGDDELSRSPT